MTSRAALASAVALLLAVATAAACSDKVQPSGSTLIQDVPPPVPPPVDDAQPPVYEASIPDGASDALYSRADVDLGACDTCACAKDTAFCFGGATVLAAMGGAGKDAGAADTGPATCTTASSTLAQIGCNTLPAACAAKPTCACIIDTLQPLYRCYLNCADDGAKWLVYCPTP